MLGSYWFEILTWHISSAFLFLWRLWKHEQSCHPLKIRWFEDTSWQNHHCVITGHSSKMTWWQMLWWEDVQRLFAMRALPLQTPSCAGSCICWQLAWILLCVQPSIFLWFPYLENAFTFNIFSSFFYIDQERQQVHADICDVGGLINSHSYWNIWVNDSWRVQTVIFWLICSAFNFQKERRKEGRKVWKKEQKK